MRLCELFDGLLYRSPTHTREQLAALSVDELITAPRKGAVNAMFVALRTPLHDGEDDVRVAFHSGTRLFLCRREIDVEKGAVLLITREPEQLLGILAARLLGHPARRLQVFAFTGSVGKSSVALLLTRMLRDAGHRVGLICSDGVDMDGTWRLPSPHVPNAAQIQAHLADMVANGSEFAVVELSGYQLQYGAANGIEPLAVALTSLKPRPMDGRDLTRYHDAMERLTRLEAPFCVMPTDATPETRATRVIRVGEGSAPSLQGFCTEFSPNEGYVSQFLLADGAETATVRHPSPFRFSAENALVAATLARIAGVPLSDIAKTLSCYAAPGRMECLFMHDRLVCLDACFSPEDLDAALRLLAPLTRGRLAVLLGSVGGRATERRVPLARTAELLADRIYLTADDPDFEAPFAICNEMRDAMAEPDRAEIIPDRRLAIHAAIRDMRPGDVLLVSGKGNLQTQLVRGERRPFPERALCLDALAEHM